MLQPHKELETANESKTYAMNTEPVLVLQMQRMGDIILSFPLFLWTKRTSPDHPVWVVAEPTFYNELLGVSPPVTYLPWTATSELAARSYKLILNLSHRPEASELAGSLQAGLKFGAVRTQSGLHVHGRWQLYRAALTGNNRHNRFHWSELNALDCVDPGSFSSTHFDLPRSNNSDNHAVGLFLGASEEIKRPDAWFWASLARELEKRGLKVVLLGGPDDRALCQEVKRLYTGRVVDACGQFGLREFAAVGQTLSMMITPDTGPMHLAAWSGLLTLNLSMGPVNPWETGPYPPGHYVLRANMSCLDCWHCRFESPRCLDHFDPAQVAYMTWRLLTPRDANKVFVPPGTRLYRTGRTPEGFYDLIPLGGAEKRASDYLGDFWRGVFGAFFGLWGTEKPKQSWEALSLAYPYLAKSFSRSTAKLAARIRELVVSGTPPGEDFWTSSPPMLRPLSGYMHMYLENADFSRGALAQCLETIELMRTIQS